MYTGLDLAADILSFSDKTRRLKICKIERLLARYHSQIPQCLLDLEFHDLISLDPYLREITITDKGSRFLNVYNDLRELVCLDNNLNL